MFFSLFVDVKNVKRKSFRAPKALDNQVVELLCSVDCRGFISGAPYRGFQAGVLRSDEKRKIIENERKILKKKAENGRKTDEMSHDFL